MKTEPTFELFSNLCAVQCKHLLSDMPTVPVKWKLPVSSQVSFTLLLRRKLNWLEYRATFWLVWFFACIISNTHERVQPQIVMLNCRDLSLLKYNFFFHFSVGLMQAWCIWKTQQLASNRYARLLRIKLNYERDVGENNPYTSLVFSYLYIF